MDSGGNLTGIRFSSSVLFAKGTGRSSRLQRTHLDTSLGWRWFGDDIGHGGADGGFL